MILVYQRKYLLSYVRTSHKSEHGKQHKNIKWMLVRNYISVDTYNE